MLVFDGQLVEGFTLEQARDNIRDIFKLSHDKAEQLFLRSSVILKKNLSQELASKYQQQLHKLGMVTLIQPMAGTGAQEDTATVDAVDPGKRQLPFQFLGQGGEYFRIWIVNILLTILTLGIYSAWAKVRNLRYFYGNTRLDGHSFEFTASPIAILKGRLIAVAFLLLYMLGGEFVPPLGIALFIVFIVALPWLVCRSMAFRNYHTRYRNIRFGFDGKYAEALKVMIGWPLAAMLTLGLLFPYAIYRQKRFLVANSRYGTMPFEPGFEARGFYAIYLAAVGMVVAGILLALIPVVGPLFPVVAYLLAFAYVSAKSSNLIYNHSALAAHGFDSRLVFTRLAFLYFTNALLILFTLGLGIPWAKVRIARYRAECLTLRAQGPLDSFVAAEDRRVGALGEEIGEAFDVDVGL
jgi:uncharacterized membrane protein YjgN (DUF898 family)